MAVTPDKVQIGTSQDYLDGVAVDTAAGTGLFRETVVLADPEAGGGLANVRELSTQLLQADKGVVTNTVIHGWSTAQGGQYVDIKANPSGALTVDATGSSVSVSNLPDVYDNGTTKVAVPNDQSLDVSFVDGTYQAGDAILSAELVYVANQLPDNHNVTVSNFPATQAVSGTVTANQGGAWNINNITGTVSLPTGAATAANQTAANASLSSLDAKMPDESGAWGYNAGTTGTLNVATNKRILAISATAPALTGGSMTINGGQTITIPAGTSITITPRANLVAPTVVFTGTASYFVEFIE